LRAPADVVRGQTFNVVEKNYQVRELALHVQEAICVSGHDPPENAQNAALAASGGREK